MKIDGKQIAQEILLDLKSRVEKLNTVPNLAIILVGNDPASISYIEQKDLKAEQIGIKTTVINLESRIQNSELIEIIRKLNMDNAVNGIIVQRPLPSHINSSEISLAIAPQKDVDGFRPNSKFQSPIFLAVLKILEEVRGSTSEVGAQKIVVIGKGETGGKPIIDGFKKMGAKPITIDSKTKNPQDLTKNADIIICAVGKSNIIKPNMIKRGAILMSVGLHKGSDGKLHGDYNEEEIKDIASFYTPTPCGVGPVNVTMLLSNVIKSAAQF